MNEVMHDNDSRNYSHAIVISATKTIVSTGDLARCKKMLKFHGPDCEIAKLV